MKNINEWLPLKALARFFNAQYMRVHQEYEWFANLFDNLK